MAITEESRFQLHRSLESVLGKEHATTMMEHLPPVGWADVATKADLKRDIDSLATRVEARFDIQSAQIGERMAKLETKLTRNYWASQGVITVMAGLVAVFR